MSYNDGYYYGQCKLVAVVDNTADNGKTVLITTDDNKTYSGTIANKKCEFLLPPRTLYTVQKVSSGSAEFTTKVEAGYGDCILVHLDTGYVEVKQGDLVGLDYIKAATDDSLKNKVPEAKAVKELNNSLGGIKANLNNCSYIGGSMTLVYNSSNQLGGTVDITLPNFTLCVSITATLIYSAGSSQTCQKIDRLCSWLEDANDNKRITIFAYADGNDFIPSDTVTVSWAMVYN